MVRIFILEHSCIPIRNLEADFFFGGWVDKFQFFNKKLHKETLIFLVPYLLTRSLAWVSIIYIKALLFLLLKIE